jgi:acyl-CoA thioesterase I
VPAFATVTGVTLYPYRAALVVLFVLSMLSAVGCREARPPETQKFTPAEEPAPISAKSTVDPESNDPRPLIVAFGDSLTAGYGADPGQSYPDFLQKMLDQQHYQYRVVNLGISGNTTKDGAERIKDVLALKPALVIVEFGGNDGLRGLPIASTRDNLDSIVRGLKEAGLQVVLAGITLPPNYGPAYIDEFNKTYVLTAQKYKVPMLPFLLQGAYGVPGSMQDDQTHATEQGNKQVARNVLLLISPLLKKN